jgi:DNA (cytosine-5)-methyltransferase 1
VADFAKLDAADFGVPQHRTRPFWFGHLAGPCVRWTARTHFSPTEALCLPLPGEPARLPWVTCREALGHLPLELLGRPVRLRKRGQHSKQHGSVEERPARGVGTTNLSDGNALLIGDTKHPQARAEAPAPTVRGGGEGHSAPQILLTNTEDAPSYTVSAKGDGRGAQGACVLKINHRRTSPDEPAKTLTKNSHSDGSYAEWPWERPATTVEADDRIAPPGHKDEKRASRSLPEAIVLSERAAAILQGFPETWVFSGVTKKARWSQIGQAMPPPLAEAVGRAVAEQLARTNGSEEYAWCASPA